MKEEKRVFITDCEGPISKNDNAFELTCKFIPEGEKFFTQISRYDDVLADVVKRSGYKAGGTLKLIVPFLKAYEVTNKKMIEFSTHNVLLMPGAKDTLRLLRDMMPSFIVSTSYKHYIRVLCNVLNFPYKKTYCTSLNIDAYHMDKEEQKKQGLVVGECQMTHQYSCNEREQDRNQGTLKHLGVTIQFSFRF